MNNVNLKTFGQRLEELMKSDGIDVSVKGANIELARKMVKEEYLNFYVNNNQGKRLDSVRSQIEKHRKATSAADISGKWLKAYCDYFKCSADYLFGYIDLPTHKITDINEQTGLSKSAIDRLIQLNDFSKLFPGSQRDKFKVINLILSDMKDNSELSSLLEYLVAFCRFDVSPDNDHPYVVNKNGIRNFHPKKTISGKGYSYNPLESHFNLKDMESMYYLKIWDSIKNLKQQYQKTPDTD